MFSQLPAASVQNTDKFHYRTFIKMPAKSGVDWPVACESLMVPYLKPKEPKIGPSISNFANSRL
jgi:hypothetical protein